MSCFLDTFQWFFVKTVITLLGFYLYLEASHREAHDFIRLLSPYFPTGVQKCLSFSYNLFGQHGGTLRILYENDVELWQRTGGTVASKNKLRINNG